MLITLVEVENSHGKLGEKIKDKIKYLDSSCEEGLYFSLMDIDVKVTALVDSIYYTAIIKYTYKCIPRPIPNL